MAAKKKGKAPAKGPTKSGKRVSRKQRAQRTYASRMRTVRARAKATKRGKGPIAKRPAARKLRRKLGVKRGKKRGA